MAIQWIVKEYPHEKMSKPVLICGLPGIGNVGKIAIDFIIESLKAKRIASIVSDTFPHCAFISEKSILDLPCAEIYSVTVGKQCFLLVTADVQPIDEKSCYAFCDSLLTYLAPYAITEMITLGGIGLEEVPEHTEVYVAATSPSLLKEYHTKGLKKHSPGAVGPIIGVAGVLLGLGKLQGIQGVSLLAETLHHPRYLGVAGARALVAVLHSKFKLKLDMNALDSEVKAIESEVRDRLEQIQVLFEEKSKRGLGESTNYIG